MADLVLRLAVAFRPLEVIDGRTIPDDAYMSLEIARSIARGLGPWYTTGHTNGFQPLYVFFIVPAFWIFQGDPVAPVRAALVLLSLFDVASLWLLYRLVASFSASRATPLLAALAWIANPYIVRTTLNGLETAMAVFFLLWALSVFWSWRLDLRLPSSGQAAGLGAILGSAGLARIDGFLLGPSLAIVLLLAHRKRWRAAALRIGTMGVGALVAYAPWLVYSYSYTGDLYPSSGPAVRLIARDILWPQSPTWDNWYGPKLADAFASVWTCNWPVLVVAAGLGIGLLVRRHRAVGARFPGSLVAAATLFGVSLLLAYALYQYAAYFFDRYLYPITFVLILAAAAFFEAWLPGSPRRRAAMAVVVAVFLGVSFALHPNTRLLAVAEGGNRMGYMQVAQWASRTFPPGTVVGSSQSGALAYFAPQLRIVNLDGVVNEACYRSIVEKRNQQYIQSAGIQYVLGWGINLAFIATHTANWDPGIFGEPQKIAALESWGNEWYVVEVWPNGR